MIKEFGLDQIRRNNTSLVTVGTFDGVHVGHQAILRYLVERAQARGGHSVVVTFDPHPRQVVSGDAMPLLSTIAERADLLEGLGVERFIVLPFTPAFSKLPPEAFVTEVLVERIGLKEIVVGYDHGFGQGRQGDRSLLEALGARHGFRVDVIPAQLVDQHVVSSTEIRRLLAEAGDVRQAADLLGRPYRLAGVVVHGDGRGKTIGFPTANLTLDDEQKVVPRRGVYAVRARGVGAKGVLGGMMNIGYRPTFDGGDGLRLEAHLFDFEGDLYGRRLRIEFVERLRDEQKFSGVEALVEQLYLDRARCMRILAKQR